MVKDKEKRLHSLLSRAVVLTKPKEHLVCFEKDSTHEFDLLSALC